MEHHDVSYKGQLRFVADYEPAIDAGRYTLEVSQQVKDADGKVEQAVGSSTDFIVSAPRFGLDEGDIFSHYPPPGGQADYDGVVSSISFSRRTLPWERSPSRSDKHDGAAWLALLLFDEDELDSGRVREIYADDQQRTLHRLADVGSRLGPDDLASWEAYDPEMRVQVLEIDDDLFDAVMPTYGDLVWLSHGRQNLTEAGKLTSELGTVLCNRLPTPGVTNTVYLVSVEQRYETTDSGCKARHVGGSQQLAILHKWRFFCRDSALRSYTVTRDVLAAAARSDHRITFTEPLPQWVGFEYVGEAGEAALRRQVLEWLGGGTGSAPADWMPVRVDDIIEQSAHVDGTFAEVLRNVGVSTLRDEPQTGSSVPAAARELIDSGHTVLRHHMRAGGRTYSWLKGALAPGPTSDAGFALPVASSDDLLVFHQTTGMFDATYAAAWALGRLKGLENKSVSTSLFRWRHEQLHAQLGHGHDHLPVPALPNSSLPSDVVDQVEAWKRLEGIPFEYLVPHPRLLPTESLRFFHLDPNWMRCFLDGFFGVAKVHGLTDFGKEQALFPGFDRQITGVLLRSDAVAGWPSLHVNAYADAQRHDHINPLARPVRVLRKERLEAEVLLLLFEGVPQTLDLYLSPEGVHSGLERDDSNPDAPGYYRTVRNLDTGEAIDDVTKVVAIGDGHGSVLDRVFSPHEMSQEFQRLLGSGNQLNAGDFGLQLIDGAPLVRYQLH